MLTRKTQAGKTRITQKDWEKAKSSSRLTAYVTTINHMGKTLVRSHRVACDRQNTAAILSA